MPRLVFGYIRTDTPDEAEIARLRTEVASFCLGRGWHLGGVFCDREVSGNDTERVGFAAALDALRVPDSVALVVPSRAHLSTVEEVVQTLVRRVRRTGCRVLALPTDADTAARDLTAATEVDLSGPPRPGTR